MKLETDLVVTANEDTTHLMIVLHGLGDSMEGYRWLPGVMNIPGLNCLLVNAPDEYYGGFSWFPYPPDNIDAEVKRSGELLFKLLDEQRERGFVPENIFLFGFSQGCLMSVEVGLRYPHRLAGIIGISGWAHKPPRLLAEQSPAAKEQRFLITHGTMDPLLPLPMVKACFDELSAGGINIDWRVFPKEHTIYGESEMQAIREFVKRSMNNR
ncbi:MAG TPA: hypothetical protein DCY13_04950 [Verrucomicrobiales bacterium]|nr:hypothetical protein [Verrucomicrobiales bacterium]